MKGFMIYENDLGAVNAVKLRHASFCYESIADDITDTLKGRPVTCKSANCSKDDTYDFEIGALIALTKMCGLEKSAKAYAEIFDDTAYGDALIERDELKQLLEYAKDDNNRKIGYLKEKDEEIKKLEEKVDGLYTYNKGLIGEIDQKNHEIISLKALKLTNESLKKDNESFRKTCEKLKEENERLINTRDLLINKNNELKEENKELNKSICTQSLFNEKLLKDYNSAQSAYEIMVEKSADLMDKVKKLEEENEKLKLDCEKLQHGYIDTDMIFCGGRQNGKQYTLLVELFKKLPQDKVDAAYREAYNTTLPVWQKEALRQAYEIRKESKEKPELPRTLDINGTVYRKSIQIKDFGEQINKLTVDSLIEESRAFTRKCVDEWLHKTSTKREEMWENIFELHKESDVVIKVKREDVNTFLYELENKFPEITWASCDKIFEAKYTIKDIYKELKTCDTIYFRLHKDNKLSYSSDPHIYPYRELKHIDYLPPMRWDLFKKGRLVVKVDADNYEDFYNKCEIELGRKPHYTHKESFTVYYKKGTFHTRPYDEKIPYKYKVVNWEDVR